MYRKRVIAVCLLLVLFAAFTFTGKLSTFSNCISPWMVSFWDIALHCSAGATTQTCPRAEAALARTEIPGAPMESSFTIRIFIVLISLFLTGDCKAKHPDPMRAGMHMPV